MNRAKRKNAYKERERSKREKNEEKGVNKRKKNDEEKSGDKKKTTLKGWKEKEGNSDKVKV